MTTKVATHKLKYVLLVAAVVVVAVCLVFRRPALLEFETSPLQGAKRVLILNPLRDRGAEATCDSFLHQLSSGDETAALTRIHDMDDLERSKVAQRERQSPLTSWRLTYVTKQQDLTTFRYDVATREDSCCGVVFLTLRKTGRLWGIQDYQRIY